MLSIGAILQDRYRVDRMLDIGAMEARYRGWDQQRGEPVFIRELTPQPDLAPEVQAALRSAFTKDAGALIALDHPHIVRVLDAFVCSDDEARPTLAGEPTLHAYLIQQVVAGQTLTDLIAREGTLREVRVVAWARDLLDALSHVHELDIIHRDLRPETILITPDDRALLTDFEITALWNPGDPRTWTAKRVMGVPQYAPPECWGMHASQIDARSDIYSLGATLYHALTGEQPLTAGERTSNPYQFLQVKALAPRVNGQTRAVILKAMELPLDKRYQTAATMRRALDPEKHDRRSRLPPPAPFLPRRRELAWPRIWGLALSTLVLFIAGLLGLWLNRVVDIAPLLSRAIGDTGLADGAAEYRPAVAPAVVVSPETPPETVTSVPIGASTTPTPLALQDPTDLLTRTSAPQPPATWEWLADDRFDSNENGWVTSQFQDDWGSTSRSIAEGVYRWEIEATQAVSRWCTPDLLDDQVALTDYIVGVDAQRLRGPESAAYGLVLRHTAGSYYLFSVRDDGYFLFSLWDGFAWDPVVDWTQTASVNAGQANRLAVKAEGARFELFINGVLVQQAESDRLTEGEAGLSISTAATDGLAVFVFDNFELWVP